MSFGGGPTIGAVHLRLRVYPETPGHFMRFRPMVRAFRYSGDRIQNLTDNVSHSMAATHALSIYASDAIYSFIPKNACSTMRYSLAIANGMIDGPKQFNWIHANNATFRASLRDLIRARYTFVILRDPFLRLASCYLDKMVELTEQAWRFQRLTNYAISPQQLTFRQFVTQLGPLLRSDHHWRPQIEFMVYQNYDDVFCLEDFSRCEATLKEEIGFIVYDARDLTKHGVEQFQIVASEDNYSDIKACDLFALKRSGRAPDLRKLYDNAIIDVIRNLYLRDIELYETACGRKTVFSDR